MGNISRAVIVYGNDAVLHIYMTKFDQSTGTYIPFDMTRVSNLVIELTCSKHATHIPIEDYTISGNDNNILDCQIKYYLLHPNAAYGLIVEGDTEDDKHFRFEMLPSELMLVVSNSSGLKVTDSVETISVIGQCGWGINVTDTTGHPFPDDWDLTGDFSHFLFDTLRGGVEKGDIYIGKCYFDRNIPSEMVNVNNGTPFIVECLDNGYYFDEETQLDVPYAAVRCTLGAGNVIYELYNDYCDPRVSPYILWSKYATQEYVINNFVQASSLGAVAFSNSYNDLYDTPDLSNYLTSNDLKTINNESIVGEGNIEIHVESQVQANWNETDTSSYAYIQNKPDLSIYTSYSYIQDNYATLGDLNDYTTYTYIANNYATQGDLGDLSMNIVQSDWFVEAPESYAYIWNKPILKQVALSGDYNDLSNTPDLSNYATLSDLSSYVQASDLATVATTGNYNDLSYLPDLSQFTSYTYLESNYATLGDLNNYAPISYVARANWNETDPTSYAYIENKPNISSGSGFIQYTYNNKTGLISSLSTNYYEAIGSGAVIEGQGGNGGSLYNIEASGTLSHAEGYSTKAKGDYSHAEGSSTSAWASYSHVEGGYSTVGPSGQYSHAEGYFTNCKGGYGAHTEGQNTEIEQSASSSHAEGYKSKVAASAYYSHAEGNQTLASGQYGSHAEGSFASAAGNASHAEGHYTQTKNHAEHASGQFNLSTLGSASSFDNTSATATLFSVGNGSGDSNRHNAFEIKQNGDIYITYNGNDVMLQSYLGGGGGGSQVQSDWNENDSSSYAYILNKPDLSVYTTYSYVASNYATQADLTNYTTYTYIANNYASQTDLNNYATQSDLSYYALSSSLATVATSGDYTDLINKPTIPAAYYDMDIIYYFELPSSSNNNAFRLWIYNVVVRSNGEVVWGSYDEGYLTQNNLGNIFTYIKNTYGISYELILNNTQLSNNWPNFTKSGREYYLDLPSTVAGMSIGSGDTFIIRYRYNTWYNYKQATIEIPYVNAVTSSTSNIKIEVVNALPASPDSNTLYIVV